VPGKFISPLDKCSKFKTRHFPGKVEKNRQKDYTRIKKSTGPGKYRNRRYKVGLIATYIEKKDSTFSLLRQNLSYCDMHREKRLNFHAFAPMIDTKARQLTQKTHDPPYCFNSSRKSTEIKVKDSSFTLLRQ